MTDTGRATTTTAPETSPDGGLRRELIDAALELVETSGTQGLSWRAVARRADVSHSAPYRHFADKEELLATVAEEGFRSLTEQVLEQMAGVPDDATKRLEAMAVAYVEFAAENPAHFRVMFGRDVPDINRHPALREAHDRTTSVFREGVADVLAELREVGVVAELDTFALMAWSLVHGLASLTIEGRVGDVSDTDVDPGGRVRTMTDLIRTLIEATNA